MRKITAAVICSFIVLVTLPAAGQTIRSGESIQVVLVEVPVNVTAKNGQPVRDLKAADFEVYDNGQRRQITNFDVIDFAKLAGAAGAGGANLPSAARRNFLVLFDASNSKPATLLRAREAATKFTAQLLPGDKVAVGLISIEQGFNLLTSFTTDRRLTGQAIETLGAPKYYQPKDPLLLAAAGFEADAKSVLAGADNERNAALADHLQSLAQTQRRMNLDAQRQNVTRQLDAYSALGQALDRVRGRKHVILLSEGFDATVLHGREDLGSDQQKQEASAIEHGEVWRVDNDARFGTSQTTSQLGQMTQTLRRSDVVLHAIDIRGLRSDVDAAEGLQKSSIESLFLLTRDTGGEVFRNTNDLGESFSRMIKQQEVTYILAFSAPTSSPGKFHELKVKVNAPGAHVINRTGYYEPGSSKGELERTLSAGEIVINQIPVDDVKIRALATPFPHSAVAQVPVVLEINGFSLLADAKGKTMAADVLIYAFDNSGLIRDFAQQRISLDLSKLREKLAGRGVKFYNTLRLEPGDYSIRTLVRSPGQQERFGFAATQLHVPAPQEKFVTQPLLFDDTSGWVMVKAPDRDSAAGYPFQVGQTIFVPAVAAAVRPGEEKEFAVFAYNVPPDALTLRATLAGNGAEQTVPVSFLGRAAGEANGPVKLVYSIKAPSARGSYSLTIALKPRDSREQRTTIAVEVN